MFRTCNLHVEIVVDILPFTNHPANLLHVLHGKIAGQKGIHILSDNVVGRDPVLGGTQPGEVQDAARSVLHEEDIVRLPDEFHQAPVRLDEVFVLVLEPAGIHKRALEKVLRDQSTAGEEEHPGIAVPCAQSHLSVPDVTLPLHLLDKPGLTGFIRPEPFGRDADEFLGRVTEYIGASPADADRPECFGVAEEFCVAGILDDPSAPEGDQVGVLREERRGPEDPEKDHRVQPRHHRVYGEAEDGEVRPDKYESDDQERGHTKPLSGEPEGDEEYGDAIDGGKQCKRCSPVQQPSA